MTLDTPVPPFRPRLSLLRVFGGRRAWLVLAALVVTASAGRADEYDVLRSKWVDMITGGDAYDPGDPATAATISSVTNSANGYWSSMNKAASRTSLWSDAASTTVSADLNTNFSRLRSMAVAYRTKGSTLKGNAALAADIAGGLDWMYANRYNENVKIYDNWWHFEIGSPMALTDTVALMYDQLTPTQIANAMRTIEKFTPSATTPAAGGSTGTFTGANRMWKIQVVAIRGLIVKDDAKLRAARDAFSQLFLYVTSGDGFYLDGSFIQHGKHAYTGGYGAALIGTIAPMLALLNGPNELNAAGSTWKVTDPNLPNVYRWVYDSYLPLLFRGGIMSMVQGREVSRSSTSEHGTGHSILQSILRISQFAPESDGARMRSLLRGWAERDTSRSFVGTAPLGIKVDAQQLMGDAAVDPAPEPRGTYVFANMDRVTHFGPGFAVGVAMSSNRIYTYESINTENLHGWYTGDGMTYLYNADLTHFSDSFWPTVNPRRLPGTTVDAGQARANGSGQSAAPATTWVGGASLDRYGAVGMQLSGWSNTLRAKKSWFMLDDQVVCLGSGITSTDGRPIETTIENRLLNSAGLNGFTVDGAAQPVTLGWSAALTGVHWAHLAGRVADSDVAYYFPAAAPVNAVREARQGAWSDINGGGSTSAIMRNYLTLWFSHGSSPSDATYAYALLPGRSVAQAAAYAAAPEFAVLENSPSAQAVRSDRFGVTAANVWNDGRYSVGGITVDRKASVVVHQSVGNIELAVSDPTQLNTGTIAVEFAAGGASVVAADAGVAVAQLSPTIRLVVDVAGAKGKTFRATIGTGVRVAPRLGNLSTRAYLAGRDDAVIAGFVVAGSGTKRLLVRAVGPTLGQFGVSGALANPQLTVVDEKGATVATNDDWSTAANRTEISATSAAVGAFALPAGSRDAALLVALNPGAYTAVVRTTDTAGSGIVLAEVYDVDAGGGAKLVNLSSRVFCGTGAQAAIVGFALVGDNAGQVLVRAAGPALAAYNVVNPLADPKLKIADLSGTAAGQNDNWSTSPLAAEVGRVSSAVGAFAFKDGSKDAAALLTLNPGSYTAVVTDAAAGNTLVEVYSAE